MEIGLIVELIGTVGFPIVCVLALGIFVFKRTFISAVLNQKYTFL